MDPTPAPNVGRKQLTHERILDTAAGVLREDGFSGVGVADIMKRAGLTHGGFYAHFASRDALLAQALVRAGQDSRARLQGALAKAAAADSFRALVEGYLSDKHLKSPGTGCPVAALASEMPRQSGSVREAAAGRVEGLIDTVRAALPHEHADAAPVIASQLVGALQLARTLGDNVRGRKHLAAARAYLLSQFEPRRRITR
jgi:TetR/AcrR family transcriptional regulator, transcriptional repressor for nem operon